MNQIIENHFPKLKTTRYRITSPETPYYNCIAWAFEDDHKWWWPDPMFQYYWPADIPREETIDAFVSAFEKIEYVTCDSSDFEKGFQKIAIYVDNYNKPTHAARQLQTGEWTSKLGGLHDIEHKYDALSGNTKSEYGNIAIIMKKKLS